MDLETPRLPRFSILFLGMRRSRGTRRLRSELIVRNVRIGLVKRAFSKMRSSRSCLLLLLTSSNGIAITCTDE